jgi:hypothetical protein
MPPAWSKDGENSRSSKATSTKRVSGAEIAFLAQLPRQNRGPPLRLERIPNEWNIPGIGEIVDAFLRSEAIELIADGVPQPGEGYVFTIPMLRNSRSE